MVAHIHRAEKALGRRCRIEMDLAGPKTRTGAIRPGPSVMKLRPTRDTVGKVTTPASVWLVPAEVGRLSTPGMRELSVPREWLGRRRRGERIELVDARGASRAFRVAERTSAGCRAEVGKTTYVIPGMHLSGVTRSGEEDPTSVGPVPPLVQRILLRIGDRLVITARPTRASRRGEMPTAENCVPRTSRAPSPRGCGAFGGASPPGSTTAG